MGWSPQWHWVDYLKLKCDQIKKIDIRDGLQINQMICFQVQGFCNVQQYLNLTEGKWGGRDVFYYLHKGLLIHVSHNDDSSSSPPSQHVPSLRSSDILPSSSHFSSFYIKWPLLCLNSWPMSYSVFTRDLFRK